MCVTVWIYFKSVFSPVGHRIICVTCFLFYSKPNVAHQKCRQLLRLCSLLQLLLLLFLPFVGLNWPDGIRTRLDAIASQSGEYSIVLRWNLNDWLQSSFVMVYLSINFSIHLNAIYDWAQDNLVVLIQARINWIHSFIVCACLHSWFWILNGLFLIKLISSFQCNDWMNDQMIFCLTV